MQTGCCPHTAIRDDITANLDAVDTLTERVPGLQLVIIESGGDNLTAVFSRGLVDRQVFVVDVAGGDKVPRKGGPGVTTADLLVINKTDLAPLVGADLDVMAGDADRVRGGPAGCQAVACGHPGRARGGRLGAETAGVKAEALLEVERGGVVRTLRSAAPLALIPVRGRPVVHLVNSAASPLGGDELTLTVRLGAHACLRLAGIAASVALPGPRGEPA